MQSPTDFLRSRESEVDEALGRCLRELSAEHEATEFVGKHPVAVLGGSAVAGLFASRLLLSGGRGGMGRGAMGLRRLVRPLRLMVYGASMLATAVARARQANLRA
jgi:hypothetical protein